MPSDLRQSNFSKFWFGLAGARAAVSTVFWRTDRAELAGGVLLLVTMPVLLARIFEIVRSQLRGEVGLDILAVLPMLVALIVGEYLTAVFVAILYSGSKFLERFAEGRSRCKRRDTVGRVL